MKKTKLPEIDVIVIGGGPAGISCALLLGRCRRKVVVFDEGLPRNRLSKQMNGFITRDGIDPKEFLSLARKELIKYDVQIVHKKIKTAKKIGSYFEVTSENGEAYQCKKLLLATGIVDTLPPVKGIESFYGKSAFHCPYCDGWESNDKKIAVMGRSRSGASLAVILATWSRNITVLTNGKRDIPSEELKKLKKLGIKVNRKKIAQLKGKGSKLEQVEFEDKSTLDTEVLFFSFGYKQHSDIPRQLKCEFTKRGVVKTDKLQQTNIPGFFVAGDASRDMQLVIVAASEGTKAGVAINSLLARGSQKS